MPMSIQKITQLTDKVRLAKLVSADTAEAKYKKASRKKNPPLYFCLWKKTKRWDWVFCIKRGKYKVISWLSDSVRRLVVWITVVLHMPMGGIHQPFISSFSLQQRSSSAEETRSPCCTRRRQFIKSRSQNCLVPVTGDLRMGLEGDCYSFSKWKPICPRELWLWHRSKPRPTANV